LGGLGVGVHTHVSKCRNDKVKGKNKAKQNEEKSVIQKQNSKKCQKNLCEANVFSIKRG
jgi:hypothetical protein